jgi:twitching motility protein PilT
MSNTETDEVARATLADLLNRAVIAGASDLHLTVGERPRVRLVGSLEALQAPPTTAGEVEAMLATVLPAHLSQAATELDFSHADATGRRYRVSAFQERRGRAIAFRVLEGKAPALDTLGVPRDILRVAHAPSGLVLFSGHAGAGKTTTLASVLQAYCERRAGRLITLEDPIEYRLDAGQAYVEQREIGHHCPTFAEGLAQAIAAQPDAISIGELRDLPTIRLALQAAETGVLVFGTVHAYDATRTIGRIVDAFELDERPAVRTALGATLRMIVAQTLLRRKDGKGRVPATEIVHGCTPLATLVREGKEHELATVIEGNASRGMRSLDDSLVELVRAGKVDRDEALAAAVHPEAVARLTA